MRRQQHLLVRVFGQLFLSFFGFATVFGTPPAKAASSPVTIGGPFTLTAVDGETVTDRTYRGRWLLVYFGYTSCPETCPTVLNAIGVALDKLGPDAKRVQPLFITVDPQRDTPEVMGKYINAFDSRIVGLTGSPQQIETVVQEYGAYSAPHDVGGGETTLMDHSTYIYLMSAEGKFVKAFDANTPGDHLAQEIRKLVAQTS